MSAESHLPTELLDRASVRGNEYAWTVDDIPKVIEAARDANLMNIGGQLQFRLPTGETCECWWISVDVAEGMSDGLNWAERVQRTAASAAQQYSELTTQCDFLQEGREGFPDAIGEFERGGGSLSEAMCFVWYVDSEETYSNSTMI